MTNKNYNCTQQELYTIAELAWQSATQHLNLFTNFKPLYDAAYFTTKMAELDHAKLLPTEDERNSTTAILRLQLADANRIVLNNFQDLKSHIADVFPPHFRTQEYIAAGQNSFDKATNRNWDSTRTLLNTAIHYIANNLATLTANQNMAPTFQTKFETDSAMFADLHKKFLDSEESGTIGAEEKVIMNNKIYNDVSKLFRDGQKIFRTNDAIRKQFTFNDVMYLVSGAGTAGLRGTIINATTGQPVSDAIFTVIQTNEFDTTSSEGKYQVSPMAHGTYSIRVIAEGYKEQIIPQQEVLVGTISTCNVELLPAA